MNRLSGFRNNIWLCLVAIMGFAGCAANLAVAPPSKMAAPSPIPVEIRDGFQWPDKELQFRFQQYWTFRKAGDAAGAFEYEAPHIREMVIWGKYDGFCRHVRGDWSLINIQNYDRITDQLITIDFNMVAKDRDGVQRDVFYRDSWLLFSGNWYHVLKDPFVTGDGFGK